MAAGSNEILLNYEKLEEDFEATYHVEQKEPQKLKLDVKKSGYIKVKMFRSGIIAEALNIDVAHMQGQISHNAALVPGKDPL